MPPFNIVFAETYEPWAVDRMRTVGTVVMLERFDEASMIAAVGDAHALLVRSYAKVTRAVLDAGRNLRVVGRAGVGLENIDVAAANERGIRVVYTPGAATDAVADLTIGLMISLVRDVACLDRLVREGLFREARESSMATELASLTLGILGMGRIGRAVGRRCVRGFGMHLIYHDIQAVGPLDFIAHPASLEEVLSRADVISLHVPLKPDTRKMIDSAALSRMKPTAYLINTARGAILDAEALADALRNSRLAGAALDVFDPEPLPHDHPLMAAPRTLFTPHIGARTTLGQRRMNDVVDDVIRVLRGQDPLYPAEDSPA